MSPDRRLVLVPLIAVLLAVLFEAGSVALQIHPSGFTPLPRVLNLISYLAMASAGLYLLFNIKSRRRVKWVGFAAVALLLLGLMTDAFADWMALRANPGLQSGGAGLLEVLQESLVLGGLAAILITAYLTLVESLAAQGRLARERERVAKHVAEREHAEQALRASEERYRAIFDGARDGIALLGHDVKFVLVNQYMSNLTGYSRDELLRMDPLEMVYPADRARVLETRRRRLLGEPMHEVYEFRVVTKLGKTLLVEASFDVLKRDGEVLGVQGVFRDSTRRWESEQALREREENYRQLFEGISDVVYVVDAEQQILAFNEITERQLGYTRVELLGLRYCDLVPRWDVEVSDRYLAQALAEGEAHWESERLRKDGTNFAVDIRARRVQYQGRPAVMLISRDITERKELEDTLRSIAVGVSSATGAEFFQDLVRHLAYALRSDLVCLGELDTAERVVRTRAVYAGGAGAEEPFSFSLVGTPCEELFYRGVTCYPEGVRSLYPEDTMLEHARAEGYIGAPLYDSDGEPIGVLVAITRGPLPNAGSAQSLMSIYAARTAVELERARTESALRSSEARLRTLFEGIDEALFVHDLEGRILDCNAAATRRLGYSREELLHMRAQDLDSPSFSAGFRARLDQQLHEGGLTCEGEHRTKDGRLITVDMHSSVIEYQGRKAVLAIVHDISERKRIEEETRRIQAQMVQAQKLESLGVLAGGIAHDFNNLLMGVLGNASLAILDLPPDSPARQTMHDIETSALRAAELAKQMLAYSGRGKLLVQALDLSRLVTEMQHLLEASVSKKIALRYSLASGLPTIEADMAQLRQLLMNLVTNAGDAIGDATGAITITTGEMEADRSYLQETFLDDELQDGHYVFLEVVDTGCGIDGETLRKVFDPFFSTKFLGRGLGLAAVLGIVRSHHGAIKVESDVGRGASFRALFPAAIRPAAAVVAPSAGLDTVTRGGAILVVDDEEAVRLVTRRALERHGFEVLSAKDGYEAIDAFREHADEIALVLLDVTMPLMAGDEVLRALRKIRTDTRVLLSSGYSEQEATSRFAGLSLAGFIQKPYRVGDLAEKVLQVLTGGES